MMARARTAMRQGHPSDSSPSSSPGHSHLDEGNRAKLQELEDKGLHFFLFFFFSLSPYIYKSLSLSV